MARHYSSETRSEQPAGPWYPDRLSLGRVIAHELAQQLQAATKELALVAVPHTNRLHTVLLLEAHVDKWGERLLQCFGEARRRVQGVRGAKSP